MTDDYSDEHADREESEIEPTTEYTMDGDGDPDSETEAEAEGSGSVEYRPTVPELFSPPVSDIPLGNNEYVSAQTETIEDAVEAGYVDIITWDSPYEATTEFDAPPEMIEDEAGYLSMLMPNDRNDEILNIKMSKWKCQRCDHINHTQAVKRGYDPQIPERCDQCERQGPFKPAHIPERIHSEEIMEVFSSDPIWEPPKGIEPADFGDVWDAVYDYIYTHWDAGEGREWLYEGLTAYALSTWFRDRTDFVPHLLVQGRHETGKTRLFNTLKQVCYRAVHTVSASPAYIFRGIDTLNITFFLSEYHDISDEVQEDVDAVLKAGQKRGESVGRAAEQKAGDYGVSNFEPFTHVGISTQFMPRDDIISRCFEINTQPATRKMPRRLANADRLGKQLIYLRYRYLNSPEFDAAEARAEQYMDEHELFNRLGEKLWCLITMAMLAERDISNFLAEAVARSQEDAAESDEALFLQATLDCVFDELADLPSAEVDDEWSQVAIKLSRLARQFNDLTGRDISTRYIGTIRKRLGLGKIRRSDGMYVKDSELKSTLRELCQQNSVEWGITPDADGAPDQDVGPDTDSSRLRLRNTGPGSAAVDSVADSEQREQNTQRRLVRRVMQTAEEIADETGQPASDEEIIDVAEDLGFDPDRVQSEIDRLVTVGALFRPPSTQDGVFPS